MNCAPNAAEATSLNQLFELLRSGLAASHPHLHDTQPTYRDFRAGDVKHSLASIDKAERLLGYQASIKVGDGLNRSMRWYCKSSGTDALPVLDEIETIIAPWRDQLHKLPPVSKEDLRQLRDEEREEQRAKPTGIKIPLP